LPQLQSAPVRVLLVSATATSSRPLSWGGILAVERSPQLAASAAMVLVTLSWKQLHLVYDVLPLTIPPAVVLIGVEVWQRAPRRWCHRLTPS